MKKTLSRLIAVSHYSSGITFGLPLGSNLPWHLVFALSRPSSFFSIGWCFSYVLVASSLSLFIFGEFELALVSKYFLVVLSAFIPFWYSNSVIREVPSISRIVFWFLIFFGFMQTLGFPGFVSGLFELAIPKFRGEPWGQGVSYRGVSLIWSEPAQASFYLLMAFVLGFWNSKKKSFALLSLALSQLFLVKSVTGIFLVFLLTLLIYPISIKRSIGVLILLLGVASVAILTNPKLSGTYDRFSTSNPESAIKYLSDRSGGRLATPLYSAYRSLGNYGIPLLDTSTLEPMLFNHQTFGLVNNVGYFSSNHGLVGGWVFLFFLIFLLQRFRLQFHGRILLLLTVLSFVYSPAWTPFLVLAARVSFLNEE